MDRKRNKTKNIQSEQVTFSIAGQDNLKQAFQYYYYKQDKVLVALRQEEITMIKYNLHLSELERQQLINMVSKGKRKATTIQKAHVLLASDEAVERQSETTMSAYFF